MSEPFACVCTFSVALKLCDPMAHSLPGSSVHGFLQARILEWVAIPFSRGEGLIPTQGSNPSLLCLLHWQRNSLLLSHQGSPICLQLSFKIERMLLRVEVTLLISPQECTRQEGVACSRLQPPRNTSCR